MRRNFKTWLTGMFCYWLLVMGLVTWLTKHTHASHKQKTEWKIGVPPHTLDLYTADPIIKI